MLKTILEIMLHIYSGFFDEYFEAAVDSNPPPSTQCISNE